MYWQSVARGSGRTNPEIPLFLQLCRLAGREAGRSTAKLRKGYDGEVEQDGSRSHDQKEREGGAGW